MGASSATKPHFHPGVHKPISKVLFMYSSYYIFFREKFFPNYIMLQTRFPRMPKIQIYSENAIMIANIFKYLPKSEAVVHTCSLKKLFWSISDNSQENTCAGASFCVVYFFHCFVSSLTCFKTLFILADQHFLFYFTIYRTS